MIYERRVTFVPSVLESIAFERRGFERRVRFVLYSSSFVKCFPILIFDGVCFFLLILDDSSSLLFLSL